MKKFMSSVLVFCIVLSMVVTSNLFSQNVFAATQASYYVSPTGSDSNPGTLASPFKTIEKAQAVVRTINSNMTGDIIIYLGGGTYNVPSTLSFTSQDSGTNGYNVIYKAYTGETPVISGGTTVTGWTLYDSGKNIYRANVGTSLNTRQFYVNGVRGVRARGEDNPSGFSVTSNGYQLPSSGTYSTMASWANVNDIEFVCIFNCNATRIGVSSISSSSVAMKTPGWTYANTHFSMGNPSWIENAYELLDSPGEWYLNRTEGYLYYKPRSGEDMSTSTCIAATVEKLLSAVGTLDAPIQNMQFDGITFSYDTWLATSGDAGYADGQTGVRKCGPGTDIWVNMLHASPAGVAFSAAKDITVKNCNFIHMGNAALSFDYGSQNNLVDYNRFSDISGNGINIGGVEDTDHHPSDTRVIVRNNTVSNNTITAIGVEYMDNAGVFVGYTESTIIKHNTLYDLGYMGICVGYGWGEPDSRATSVAKNNIISHNLIYNFMMKLNDGGGIYTLGSQPGSKVYNNYVYGDKNEYAYLYRDNGTAGYYDTNNVISSLNGNCNKWYYTNTGSGGIWNAHDNSSYYNYYSSEMTTMGTGGTNVVSDNYAVSNYAWDSTAQAIIANAGVGGGDGPLPNFTPPGGTNLALNQPVTVSNYYQNNSSYNGAKAVDGNTITRWATDENIGSAWIEIDFPSSTTFNKTVLKECTDYGQRIKTYEIQYWNGSVWVNAYSGGVPSASQTDTFATVTSNKVRLNISSINGIQGPTVWEFEVYAATTINDTDSGITYSSMSLSSSRGTGDYNDDVHYATANGAYFQYTFTGTGVDLITEKYSDEGNMDIYIDGVLQTTVNCSNSTRLVQQTVYSKTGLASGSHTIKAVKKDGTYMLLDALKIYN